MPITTQNSKSIIQRLGYSVMLGFLSSLILGFVDFYFGNFLVKMSINIYMGFFTAYILACILLGIIVIFIVNLAEKFSKSKTNYNGIYFVCLLFLYDYVIVNVKLNGMFNLLNFRAIFVNLFLLFAMIILIRVIHKVEKINNYFSNYLGFLQIAVLAFTFTAGFNYFLLDWMSPPESKLKVIASLISIIAIPYLAIFIKNSYDSFLSKLTNSEIKFRLFGFGVAVFLALFITQIFKFSDSDLPYYENENFAPDENQVSKLKGKPNIIWIVLDTARKDHFSFYGYERKTTPFIDEFSKDGVLFTNYISTAPWTLPSHASMFTGMYPSKHGAHFTDDSLRNILGSCEPLAYENLTLAEILSSQGFNTGAVVSNRILSKTASQVDQGFNFYRTWESPQRQIREKFFWGLIFDYENLLSYRGRGFFRYNKCKLASEINETALRWLDKNSAQPFFLFLNYIEAHAEVIFHLPESYDSLYGFNWDKWNKNIVTEEDIKEINIQNKSITPEQLQIQYDWLDCKMTYLDHQIGQLFKNLKKMKLYDDSMIILTSDHGDLFGEHDAFDHNYGLYNELINVPLIIKYPKSMKLTGVNDKFVQTVDLMPEVLKVFDLPLPEGTQGQPISEADHSIVSELFRCKYLTYTMDNPDRFYQNLKAIYSPNGYKLIQSSTKDHHLYNLFEDPKERNNIISKKIMIGEELDQQLISWRESFNPVERIQNVQRKISKELEDQLRSLGYIK